MSFISTLLLVSLPALIIIGCVVFYKILKMKNMENWFFSYLKGRFSQQKTNKPKHVMFCFVDHYEPQWGMTTGISDTRIPVTDPKLIEQEYSRVDRWCVDYPAVASKHTDADGIHPQHGFFYPEEEYRYDHLAKIADLCAKGFGEIEVHLHHHDDTEENMTKTLLDFTETLHNEHGAFTRNKETGLLNYSFIHGNWSLCNSRSDGQYCGINNELIILKETGCYADYTYPSAPSDTQPKKINSIYYAKDKPGQPRSHETGVDVKVNGEESGDLMIIQGPLGLNLKNRKKGIFPQIENGDIRGNFAPTNDRVDLWVNAGVQVKDKPEWTFVKVHTHGTQEDDMDCLLGKPFDEMCTYLEAKYNDGENYILHYVSPREMYNIIKAAEAGKEGGPNEYRDFVLPKPKYKTL